MEATTIETTTEQYLRTELSQLGITELSPKKVDIEARTIQDVIMCQTGEARGHGVHLEEEFLFDMLAFINKTLSGQVRANFNHNWDNMGKQLGRFTSVRVQGNKLIGDLNIFEVADQSPFIPGMGSYVLKLALEDPKSIMSSIRFQPKYNYQYDDEGKRVKMKNWSWWDGKFENQDTSKKLYVKFGALLSTDLVAEGAVTDSLFHRNHHKMSQETPKPEPTKEELQSKLEELQTQLQAATEKIAELTKGDTPPTPTPETPPAKEAGDEDKYTALTEQITALEKKIEELSAEAADEHTSGKGGQQPPATKAKKYSSVTEMAIQRFDSRQTKETE